MMLKAPQHYVRLFTSVSLRYLMTLSISGQYTVCDMKINEYGAYGVIKLAGGDTLSTINPT
jgi:hypothetical protein